MSWDLVIALSQENPEGYKQYLRLIRIGVDTQFKGLRMVEDGWTVERVAEATIEQLTPYAFGEVWLAEYWKKLAIEGLKPGGWAEGGKGGDRE
jgi:hypothetical protein